MPLASATRLGPYEIVAPLGAGGMGEVYRARDTRLGREVALKVLPPAMALDPARRARFEQEARAAAALSHPNIVGLHDVGEAETSSTSSANWCRVRRWKRSSSAGQCRRRSCSLLPCRSRMAWLQHTRRASPIATSSPQTLW